MFDPRQTQINESYLSTVDTVIKTSRELSKILIYAVTEIAKVILEKLKEAHEASKIAIEVGKDTYNLVPDESAPGAYKWEKVDLTNQETDAILMPDLFMNGEYTIETEPFTDYQAQTIAARLVEDVTDLDTDYQQTDESALKITAYLVSDDSQKQIIIYEQNHEGKCTKNLVTETLNQDEIINLAGGSLVKLLPPSSEIIKNHENRNNLLIERIKSKLTKINQLVNGHQYLIEQSNLISTNQSEKIENVSVLSGNILSEDMNENNNNQTNFEVDVVPVNSSYDEKERTATFLGEIIINNPPKFSSPSDSKEQENKDNPGHNQFFTQELEDLETNSQRKHAPEFTYERIANSQGVEPAAQQWARQVEVPIYQINNKQARQERYKGENQEIAKTATLMLKKYGTVEQDGSRIYRSDAFVVRQQGDTISIHRRNDELFGWENSLMEFKLNKKEEPKITKNPEMLPVERQEFLMVAEHLSDNGKLPDLNSADIRDVANSLGSLAPAGTIKTLEVFKQNELLLTLNKVLLQVDKEELTVGEFTIKRTRDPENNRASLQLFKTNQEKGIQELVRFDLTKTETGITKEVTKINISDYEINQVKFIAKNAQKLNLEQIFGNEQPTSVRTPKEQPIQAAGDIPVKVHPYIAEEWANMVKHGGSDWGGAMNQGNEEIIQRIKHNEGKLPIADQREMYFKIMTHKATVAEKQGENTMDFVPLKDIMNDLQRWRAEAIKQQYTPTENIPSPQRQTSVAPPKTKSREVEL